MNKDTEPLAYKEGVVEFYDCTLAVDRSVLIPRQETEILVDIALKRLQSSGPLKVLDLCCGSGCIGLAIKKARPQDTVHLSDISDQALRVAQANALTNKLDVTFHKGDLYIPKGIDVLFCNPPYVTTEEYRHLDPSVKDYEPRIALDGGVQGLDFYERIANSLHNGTWSPQYLFFEIGTTQGDPVTQLFSHSRYHLELLKDWAGHDRFCILTKFS